MTIKSHIQSLVQKFDTMASQILLQDWKSYADFCSQRGNHCEFLNNFLKKPLNAIEVQQFAIHYCEPLPYLAMVNLWSDEAAHIRVTPEEYSTMIKVARVFFRKRSYYTLRSIRYFFAMNLIAAIAEFFMPSIRGVLNVDLQHLVHAIQKIKDSSDEQRRQKMVPLLQAYDDRHPNLQGPITDVNVFRIVHSYLPSEFDPWRGIFRGPRMLWLVTRDYVQFRVKIPWNILNMYAHPTVNPTMNPAVNKTVESYTEQSGI